ncbi:hypothetical protein LTR37_017772 [Vermiconidia calcicola]|uniref:Uncharacterized protein n=1 Tax=Vermiconidia calcicola TaxID=1690605 RepID=A0ACC3MKK2_9PEZI|nr:hypothetical protein LTR37_017772 [Vermiconidia calcicola]
MSAANLDAIKKKYKFKDISIATWRDPSLSVHPARGGPKAPTILPEVAGKPFVPTYKVKYNTVPEPTDDEESGKYDEDESSRTEAVESQEQPTEDPEPQSQLSDPVLELPLQGDASPTGSDSLGWEGKDDDQPFAVDTEAKNDLTVPGTTDQAPVADAEDEITALSRSDSTANVVSVEPSDDNPQGESTTEEPTTDNAQPELTPEAADVPLEEPLLTNSMESEGEHVVVLDEEHGDERRVSFAPGTPEPKPTSRKKKSTKGTKGKKKKVAVPIDELPPNVLAMVDSAFLNDAQVPVPEVPTKGDMPTEDVTEVRTSVGEGTEEKPQEDQILTEPLNEDSGAGPEGQTDPNEGDATISETPADVPADEIGEEQPPLVVEPLAEGEQTEVVDVVDVPTMDPPAPLDADTEGTPADTTVADPDPDPIEMPAPEKSSKKKASKSKKKSSKTTSKGSPPAGLGVDFPPVPAIPSLDDILKDLDTPPTVEGVQAPEELAPTLEADVIVDGQQDGAVAIPDVEEEASAPSPTDLEDAKIEAEQLAASEAQDAESHDAEAVGADEDVMSDAPDQAVEADLVSEPFDGTTDDLVVVVEESHDVEDDSAVVVVVVEEQPQDVDPEVSAESSVSPVDSGVETELTPKEDAASGDSEASASEHAEVTPGEIVDEAATDAVLDDAALVDEPDQRSKELPEDLGEPTETGSAVAEGSPDESLPAQDLTPELDPAAGETEDLEGSTSEATTESLPETAVEQQAELIEQDEPVADVAATVPAVSEVEVAAEIPDDAPPEDLPSTEEPANASPEGDPLVAAVDADPPTSPINDGAEAGVKEVEVVAETPEDAPPDPTADEPAGAAPEIESVADPAASPAEEGVEDETKEPEPTPVAPPSPTLSKSSSHGSHKHKADHWERKHADNPLKEVLEDSHVLQRPHGSKGKRGLEEVRIKERHRKPRSTTEEDEERRRRRRERKAEEAAQALEEGKRREREDRERRIRHEERKAARAEEKAKAIRAEAEAAYKRDEEARHRRHREHDRDRVKPRCESNRNTKSSPPSGPIPLLAKGLGIGKGESVHGEPLIRTHSGGYRPAKERRSSSVGSAHRERRDSKDAAQDVPKEAAAEPSSSGAKSHHRHRPRRSETDRASRSRRDSEHKVRRPVLEERPRSFFGALLKGL